MELSGAEWSFLKVEDHVVSCFLAVVPEINQPTVARKGKAHGTGSVEDSQV